MTKHAKISYVKSAVRLLGYMHLLFVPVHIHAIYGAALLLIAAEILGIIEEFGA